MLNKTVSLDPVTQLTSSYSILNEPKEEKKDGVGETNTEDYLNVL